MVKCGLKDKICVYINIDNIIGTKYIELYYKCFASKKLCLNVNVSNRVLYTFYGQSPYIRLLFNSYFTIYQRQCYILIH